MSNPVLEPVEGITVEQWAQGQAKLAAGGSADEIIAGLGIDAPKWDRVSAEWMTRMSNDTDFVIIPVYSAAFNQSATGNLGGTSDIDENTMPLEKYAEAMAAQSVLGQQGRDAQDVLNDFGMTVSDFSNVGAFWNKKMLSDYTISAKFGDLLDSYMKKYESMTGNAHDDIEF